MIFVERTFTALVYRGTFRGNSNELVIAHRIRSKDAVLIADNIAENGPVPGSTCHFKGVCNVRSTVPTRTVERHHFECFDRGAGFLGEQRNYNIENASCILLISRMPERAVGERDTWGSSHATGNPEVEVSW
jgi:hypothetical protein